VAKPLGARGSLFLVDRQAQIEFCSAEYPRLVGAMALYMGDRELAIEIAQEALTRAVARWPQVERMAVPGAWAYRVAINLANSTYRRRRLETLAHQRVVASVEVAGPGLDVSDAIAVRDAVAGLPKRQRAAIVLRYYADLPVREVASLLRVKEGTVKALTHQGIENLRGVLALDEPDEVTHE
jgi:RNA polymerase sigma-70 factor (ECF subfamily)